MDTVERLAADIHSPDPRTVALVTGANSGIGLET